MGIPTHKNMITKIYVAERSNPSHYDYQRFFFEKMFSKKLSHFQKGIVFQYFSGTLISHILHIYTQYFSIIFTNEIKKCILILNDILFISY